MSRSNVAVLGLLLLVSGCPQRPRLEPDRGPVQPARPRPDPAVADIPFDESAPDDRSRWPRRPASPPAQVAIRSLLVRYKGVAGAGATTRSRAEAERRARRLVAAARKQGADFAALAARFSEEPAGQRASARVVSPGELPRAVERAAFGMGVGQVSDPVATRQGFVVVMREQPEEYSSAHILIQYKGAKSAPVAITRSKQEARALAEKVRALAVKPDAQFAVLAARNSDSPSRIRGGVLRPMTPGQMPPDYNNYLDALRALKVGEISPVVETPFGFHIIKRLKLQRIRASHILIAFKGSEGEAREERSRRDAEILARKLQKEATADPASFGELARKHSDDSDTADKGGDLGTFARGLMPARFEQIAFSLRVGQISDPVETALGFHVIMRTE